MCKILIADDEYLEREVMKRIVRDIRGAELVGEVNSGRKALELYKILKPDLIFLNYNMGGINGIEAAKFIRKDNKDAVIILTTANDDQARDERIIDLDIEACLLKPVRPKKIEEIIERHVNREDLEGKKISPRLKKNLNYYPKQIMTEEIRAALDYIDKNFRKGLTLEGVSGHVYLSTYYFSRLFKKEVGVNFSSYIMHKKIDEAKRMLELTDKSILEISSYLNFKEQNYFCKVFKKLEETTPSEYRKNFHAKQSERKNVMDKYIV